MSNRNTTLNLPASLIAKTKAYAAAHGTSMTAIIREHLETVIWRDKQDDTARDKQDETRDVSGGEKVGVFVSDCKGVGFFDCRGATNRGLRALADCRAAA